MNCQYCGETCKLIKAHVIPEAFFRRLRDGQDPPRLLTNKEREYPKRMPIGIYDSNILCKACELGFGDWDNYAQGFLGVEPKGSIPIMENAQIAGYEVQEYRYDLLKLFFISLLWRASVSRQTFYSKVKLGPFENIAKGFMGRKEPGTPEDFSVTLAKFDHPLGDTILDPHPEKREGINYYRFYLGSYVAYIKVDKRRAPGLHADFMMKPKEPLRIIGRNIERSKELPLIRDIATSANNANSADAKKRRT